MAIDEKSSTVKRLEVMKLGDHGLANFHNRVMTMKLHRSNFIIWK